MFTYPLVFDEMAAKTIIPYNSSKHDIEQGA